MLLPWDELAVQVSRCGRVRCTPQWRLASSWSATLQDYDLWLVWAGRGRMRLRGGRVVHLQPGTCLWMRPGGLYDAEHEPADPLGVTFIHFDLTDSTGGRPASLPPEVHEFMDVSYLDGVLGRVVALEHELAWPETERPGGARAAARQLLRGVLMDLDATSSAAPQADPPSAPQRLVHRLAARLRSHPTPLPGVAELAAETGYSPDHLTRLFKDVIGRSLQAYIVDQRITRARQLLSESTLTVAQVAEALGYQSVYFFSRQFKQKTGRSPTAYRQEKGQAEAMKDNSN